METRLRKQCCQRGCGLEVPALTDLVFDDGEPLETNRHWR